MVSPKDTRVLGVVEAGYQKPLWKHIYDQDIQTLSGFVDYAVRAIEHEARDLLEKIEHEFTAPIIGIRNNASFLQRRFTRLPDSVIRTKIEDTLEDCELLLRHVSTLRYVLGQRTHAYEKRHTWVFRDIIVKAINQLKPFAQEKGFNPVRMSYEEEDIPKIRIYVEREKLSQVVYNLLTNAIKYACSDPSAFAISVSVDETETDFIVKFRDRGIGIEPELKEKIFERGFRAPDAFRRHVSGTGLGLTIARDIAKELGGDLWLAHNRRPTEFHLRLPKSLKEAPDGKKTN
jgi:signal transduction histidine kinase